MKKKIFCFVLAFLMIANMTINTYKQVEAAALPIAEGVATLVKMLIGIGITCGVVDEAIDNQERLEELSDEELQELYNAEQQYLQDMKFYMVDGSFGSTANCSVMTADGSILTLEEALDTATSMSLDDYMEMRKGSNSPTPQPGIDWGAIFIDNAVGGLMDFLADFLNDKTELSDDFTNENYMIYTGDEGYINRQTGELNVKVYTNSYYSSSGTLSKRRFRYNVSDVIDSDRKGQYRMCVVLDGSLVSLGSGYRGSWHVATSVFDVAGNPISTAGTMYIPGSFDLTSWYIEPNTGYLALNWSGYDDLGASSRVFSGYYYCNTTDITSFEYFSTNLPIFQSTEEAVAYLNGLAATPINSTKPNTYINDLCNNYKNKIVTLTSVDDYGVTPTPTPSPTPKPTATPTPSPTPTPTPYPTWDKSTGDNFTNYNFYTEVSNSFVNVQTTLNNISQSITNIYNFFQIDTQEISCEMQFDSPAYKFDSVTKNVDALKTAFGNDVVDEETGLLEAEYPKISMKCPKILEPIVYTVDEDGEKEIVIVDFKDYALWFVRLREFLKAIMWIGMVFWLMKEIKVVFTV